MGLKVPVGVVARVLAPEAGECSSSLTSVQFLRHFRAVLSLLFSALTKLFV